MLAASLILVGCSSPQSTESPSGQAAEISVAPAAGEIIAGSGYSYSVPEGWAIPAGLTLQGVDTFAGDLTDDDGFVDNVNVVLSPRGLLTADEVESAGVAELEAVGGLDVTVRDRVIVTGSESAHLSALLTSDGSRYYVEQYYLSDVSQSFVVTFSYSTGVAASDRESLAESVLASWSWE